jgi:hypothetical protein
VTFSLPTLALCAGSYLAIVAVLVLVFRPSSQAARTEEAEQLVIDLTEHAGATVVAAAEAIARAEYDRYVSDTAAP